MNADELDAAREAVSATRTWRDQMRADWGVGFREPEEVLDEAVDELIDERNRLRAVVDAVRALLKDDAVLGYPIVDYIALEAVLAQLDVSPVMGTADRADVTPD